MIKFFPKTQTDFSTLGLSGIVVISAQVYEEINGAYTLEVTVPADENRIEKEMIICAPTPKNGMQPFRIYMPAREDGENKTYYARHIFYDLLDNFLEDCRVSGNGPNALDKILRSTQYSTPFTYTSDVTRTAVAYYEMMSPVEAILGADNSLVNRWGGEIERDGFNIGLKNRLSTSTRQIRYAKNLQAFELQMDYSNVVTRIMPTGLKADGQTLLKLPERYVDSARILDYTHPKVKRIHYGDVKVGTDEGEFATEQLALAELRRRAAAEFSENAIDQPTVTGQISIVDLSKIEEYKDISGLEKIYLGDNLNISNITDAPLTAKVVAYRFDALSEKYISIEVGTEQKVIGSSIRKNLQELAQMMIDGQNFLELTIEEQTEILHNALGGYVLKRNGEILVMDTEDPLTCTKCWRLNLNGFGYSPTGYNGPYTMAITMDGKINASLITAGEFDGAYIKAGSIKADKLEIGKYFTVENDTLYLYGNITNALYPKFSARIGPNDAGYEWGAFTVNYNQSGWGDILQVYPIRAAFGDATDNGVVITSPFLTNTGGTNRKGINITEHNVAVFNNGETSSYAVYMRSGKASGKGSSVGCIGNSIEIGTYNTNGNLWINYYEPPFGIAHQNVCLGNGTQGGYAHLWVARMNANTFVLKDAASSFTVDALLLLAGNAIGVGDYNQSKDLYLYGKHIYANGVEIGV